MLKILDFLQKIAKQRADRKPGSVFDDHPSSTVIARSIKRLTFGRVRAAPTDALLSLAPDGVYTAAVSPQHR